MCSHTKIIIRGTVQGVGFRPFVYRAAREHGLTGDVCNTGDGVVINVYGADTVIRGFITAIRADPPPLASIRSLEVETQAGSLSRPMDFVIIASNRGEKPDVDITRDTAVCGSCLDELRDPRNRRYRHPFITCTQCGPRYTIIRKLPYDRPDTVMDGFPMCPECAAEYVDPASRRFHTQTVCCNNCGPRLLLTDAQGTMITTADPTVAAVGLLGRGKILAIKGIGGFHIACRGDRAEAVARLRERKFREEKPLAVMVRDVATARRYARISTVEESILAGPEAPIVVCVKRGDVVDVTCGIAPGMPSLGIMLPYAPVHHLLFADAPYDMLVMTSGNMTDEPMACTDDQVREHLCGIADAILTHDRDIHVRADDSIVRVIAGAPVIMRRARGYAPQPLPLARKADGIAGIGGIYKTSTAIGRGFMCYQSQYIGPSDSVETYGMLCDSVGHLARLLDVHPCLVAGDSHTGAPGRQIAADMGIPFFAVQHHHAHAAACLAEHGICDKTVCVVYDGTGAGDDGTVWGGEVLIADLDGYERAGHLAEMPMPGGEACVNNPGRMAMGALFAHLGGKVGDALGWMPSSERDAVMELLATDTNCIRTSSMGRLFDAAASLLNVCSRRTYEGQPAMMLEGVADPDESTAYPAILADSEGISRFDGGALLCACLRDMHDGIAVSRIAGRFHNSVAVATVEMALRAAAKTGSRKVCLSGGCFQNALLTGRIVDGLRKAGLDPLVHRLVPPNDGGISFGLVAVASGNGGGAVGSGTHLF